MRPTQEQIEEARHTLRFFRVLPPDPVTDKGQAMLRAALGPGVLEAITVLLAATAPPEDIPRPDDMAELARLVAAELRDRGFWPRLAAGFVWMPFHAGMWPYSMFQPIFDNLSPREIASVIQAEERTRARGRAGDE